MKNQLPIALIKTANGQYTKVIKFGGAERNFSATGIA